MSVVICKKKRERNETELWGSSTERYFSVRANLEELRFRVSMPVRSLRDVPLEGDYGAFEARCPQTELHTPLKKQKPGPLDVFLSVQLDAMFNPQADRHFEGECFRPCKAPRG